MGTRKTCVRSGLVVFALLGVVLAPASWAATITTTPFRGVTLHQRTEVVPRPLRINVVEIDLGDPGVAFRVTPSNGPAEGETTRQTTRSFLDQQDAQLAINASFYGLVGATGADNVGLTASDGDKYSPFGSGFEALNITSGNVANIVRQQTPDPTGFATDPVVDVYNAVSGNERIITGGVNTAVQAALEPRTAAGIATGNRLVLITVDGRQGVSQGVSTIELANLLLGYGVTDALNLDGGGSTTMAIADPIPRLLNVPVGLGDVPGTERAVGANLAVFAAPIPEPGLCVAFACLLPIALLRSRR